MECVRCGATAMIDGSLTESSSGGDVLFASNEKSFLKRMFSIGNRKIKAFACLHCSHLELMVEFTDKDRKKYQDFSGPQPGVIDRIAE
jgi:predicted nucleic-acid-binding Zn-ribbon protein